LDLISVKRVIKEKFAEKEFTVGDIYYSLEDKWNKSKFGTLFNIMIKLTKENYLKYRIQRRGVPLLTSKAQRVGAIYSLK